MDYSKVKFVKPSVDGVDITKGKVYNATHEFNDCFRVNDDSNYSILVVLNNDKIFGVSDFRFGWIPCDKNGKELSND